MEPEELAGELLADPHVSGLTLSGGEPMAQAGALARTVRLARSVRDLTVLCYTGYRLTQLRRPAAVPDAADLLAEVDVLIDGRYVPRLNNGRGLRGSTNQRVHYLTDRLRGHDFVGQPRVAELRFGTDDVHIVGVPPAGLLRALDEIAAVVPPHLGLELAGGPDSLAVGATGS